MDYNNHNTTLRANKHLNLPRKLLNYRIPLDGFLKEVNKIIDLDILQFHNAI